MARLPKDVYDPTLQLVDVEMERLAVESARRHYLGMSAIGEPCSRKLWYGYNESARRALDASTVRIFADGHRSEAVIAGHLRATPGIKLDIVDPNTGEQFAVEDHDGEFRGHLDGVIKGLAHDPDTVHVWEAKSVNEKKFLAFRKLKDEIGELNTLKSWDAVYYAQAQCYMGYGDIDRHYLTVCTPGVRQWEAVVTHFDRTTFDSLRDKAKRIINAQSPLARISNDPSWHQCKWCHFSERCHGVTPLPA